MVDVEVAQVAEAVEVEPTVISVNSVAAVVVQDMVVAVEAALAVPQLQVDMVVVLVDLLLLLHMVVLQLTVVAVASEEEAMATHPAAVANPGGKSTLLGAALFLFDWTSVHLRRTEASTGILRGYKILILRYLLLRFDFTTFDFLVAVESRPSWLLSLCKWGRLNSRFSTIERHKNR